MQQADMSDERKDTERTEKPSLSEGIIAAASEGLIVAAISAIAYLFAFAYEAGFAEVFNIPLSFITIRLTNVFVIAGSLSLVGQLVLNIGNLIFVVSSTFSGLISQRMKFLMLFFLWSVALIIITVGTRLQTGVIRVLVIGWAIGLLFQFIFPLLTQRDINGYREKLAAQDKLDAHTQDLLGLLAQRLGVGPYNLMLSLLMALVVVYYAGQSAAMRQDRYLVTSTSPQMVVLRVYGDNIICAPIDRNSGSIEHSFTVLKLGEDPDLMLYSEQVGPLRLKEQASANDDLSTVAPAQSIIPTPQP
jgi:hypothetical protein